MQALAPDPSTDIDIDAVLERAAGYLRPERLQVIRDAYEFAEACHQGQRRRTGHAYITHPVEVTYLAAELGLDHFALAAALLHDVQEDCHIPNAEIARRFGDEVAGLVEGLTKLDRLPLRVGADEIATPVGLQAQNLRKMLLAMAEDIRVVLIKLCDRLHNMRTLYAFNPEKQRRIARETMDIFAPLANRLGMWNIKWELEDLAFRYLEPERYKEIADRLASKRQTRERYINDAMNVLREELARAGIEAEVAGRAKHIHSIDQKMRRYASDEKTFDQIYDLLALRVIVDTIADCYHALGVVHALWRPLPGQFDDYIANPKDSMYQSLHTTVVALGGRPLEVQIRTHDMHEVAEYGVAAHWRYKEGDTARQREDEERISWLRHLLEWQRDLAGAEEFLETVKTDIFQDQVFVFTPKGDVLDLPAGATPLDFAFRIHTDLGYQTVGAKVNGKMTALNSTLKNGDVIEIMRSRSRGPSRDWLNESHGYVQTSHARQKIRQWFRKQRRAESIDRGREMIEKEMRRLAVDVNDRQEQILQLVKYSSWEELLAAIGYGDVSLESITRKLSAVLQEEEEAASGYQPELIPPTAHRSTGTAVRVFGVGNLLTTMARCCNPLPGDPILGYVTRSRGVTIHRADCQNVLNEDEPERLVDVEWGASKRLYPASIRVESWDRVGLLRDISTLVAEENVNMVGVQTVENGDDTVTVLATLETTGIEQISRLLSRIETIRGVVKAERSIVRKHL